MRSLNLDLIIEEQRKFIAERDWDQFHTLKNLAISLSIEASELLECFQWISNEASSPSNLSPEKREAVRDELADVLYYLIRLADKAELDLEAAYWEKFRKTKEKYPVDKSKGSSKKYTEF